jgi:hypothetical protein
MGKGFELTGVDRRALSEREDKEKLLLREKQRLIEAALKKLGKAERIETDAVDEEFLKGFHTEILHECAKIVYAVMTIRNSIIRCGCWYGALPEWPDTALPAPEPKLGRA